MKKLLNNQNSKISKEKQKISGIIFSRAFCSIGIIIFHYFAHAKGNYKLYFKTANSGIGLMLVTNFLCMSGAVLYYNYPIINSKKKFYYKRWKSILPSYYICNIYFYITISLNNHKLCYKGPYKNLILNLIGLDGYLVHSYGVKAFNLVGEWFLGVIIIIYFLYPLLTYLMNINILIIHFIISINYYLIYKTNIYGSVINERNIIFSLNSFYFGMIVIKFKKYFFENKLTLIICFILLIFLSIFKINSSFILIRQIQGYALFIILVEIGTYIISKDKTKIFNIISNLSYSIFLYHHRIIKDILKIYNPKEIQLHLMILIEAFILIIICANIHSSILNYIFKSKIFIKFDSFFLN